MISVMSVPWCLSRQCENMTCYRKWWFCSARLFRGKLNVLIKCIKFIQLSHRSVNAGMHKCNRSQSLTCTLQFFIYRQFHFNVHKCTPAQEFIKIQRMNERNTLFADSYFMYLRTTAYTIHMPAYLPVHTSMPNLITCFVITQILTQRCQWPHYKRTSL